MKWEKMDVDLKQQKSNRFPWFAFPKTRLGFRLPPQKSQTSFPGLLSQGSRLGFRFVPWNLLHHHMLSFFFLPPINTLLTLFLFREFLVSYSECFLLCDEVKIGIRTLARLPPQFSFVQLCIPLHYGARFTSTYAQARWKIHRVAILSTDLTVYLSLLHDSSLSSIKSRNTIQ
jgi:hypothetical protein